MKDRWMNVGHEEEELKPYSEPELDLNDAKRIGEYLSTVSGTASRVQGGSGGLARECSYGTFSFKILHYHLMTNTEILKFLG